MIKKTYRFVIRPFKKALKKRRRYQETDAFLISYPKCGRTWLRMMIGVALKHEFTLTRDDPTGLYKLTCGDDRIPTLDVVHEGRPDEKSSREIEGSSKRGFREKRVIFLVRDPRDAVVSNYFESTKRVNTYSGTISEFIRRRRGGVDSIIAYFNVWARRRDVPRAFLLVTYEQLHNDAHGQLRRVFEFLSLPDISDEAIAAAVEAGSFRNMRAVEQDESVATKRLSPGRSDDPESYKVRKGKVGGYHEYLTDDDVRYLNERIDAQLHELYAPYRTAH